MANSTTGDDMDDFWDTLEELVRLPPLPPLYYDEIFMMESKKVETRKHEDYVSSNASSSSSSSSNTKLMLENKKIKSQHTIGNSSGSFHTTSMDQYGSFKVGEKMENKRDKKPMEEGIEVVMEKKKMKLIMKNTILQQQQPPLKVKMEEQEAKNKKRGRD